MFCLPRRFDDVLIISYAPSHKLQLRYPFFLLFDTATYLTTIKLSLKFTITLAAIAIAALLPTASAATLKGAQDDDIDAKHRELNGVFGPPENADPQKPDLAPGKQLDIATNCAGKSALV